MTRLPRQRNSYPKASVVVAVDSPSMLRFWPKIDNSWWLGRGPRAVLLCRRITDVVTLNSGVWPLNRLLEKDEHMIKKMWMTINNIRQVWTILHLIKTTQRQCFLGIERDRYPQVCEGEILIKVLELIHQDEIVDTEDKLLILTWEKVCLLCQDKLAIESELHEVVIWIPKIRTEVIVIKMQMAS